MFYPLHTMAIRAARYRWHPVAEKLAWRGINLHSWLGLPVEPIKDITVFLRSHLQK
jgi:hypothetical protein